MTVLIGIAAGLAGLGVTWWSIQRVREAIRGRHHRIEDRAEANLRRGMKLFQPFDIWTSR